MKIIQRFRREDYGWFIDLEDTDASVAVDPTTGDLLLNEGIGEDRFHGAAISNRAFQRLTLEDLERSTIALVLEYGSGSKHTLGITNEKREAEKWIREVTSVITAAMEDPTAKIERQLYVQLQELQDFAAEQPLNWERLFQVVAELQSLAYASHRQFSYRRRAADMDSGGIENALLRSENSIRQLSNSVQPVEAEYKDSLDRIAMTIGTIRQELSKMVERISAHDSDMEESLPDAA